MNELALWTQLFFLAFIVILVILYCKGTFHKNLALGLAASTILIFLGVASIKYTHPLLSGDLIKWLTIAITLTGSLLILVATQTMPKKQQ